MTAPRLRIAVLSRVFAVTGGGAERYSVAVAEELAQQHEVHIYAQTVDHQNPQLHYHQVSRPFAKPRWLNQWWYAWRTWQLTRRGFDIVHSHENTWHGDWQTLHVKPVRHSLLHGCSGWRLALRYLKIALSPRLLTYLVLEAARLRAGHRCIVTSQALQTQVVEAYPHMANRLEVIAPGVHVPQQAPDRTALRAHLGLRAHDPLLLFVANDYARKGLSTLFQALSQLPANVQLNVAGNAKDIPAFEREAQKLGIYDRVFFWGPQKDLTPLYCACDVLVHPTREDTFAMVVLEAMAHGLPVVVSRAPYCGISADLTHGQEALLLDDPQDAQALVTQLQQVLTQPELASQLQAAGLAYARAHNWHTVAAQYADMIRPHAADTPHSIT